MKPFCIRNTWAEATSSIFAVRPSRIVAEKRASAVDAAVDVHGAIAAVAEWATLRSRQGNWSLLILEQAHQRGKRAGSARAPEARFRSHWRQLGERPLHHTTRKDLAPQHLGAVVFELTHAPAMSIVSQPSAGDLVAMTLRALLVCADCSSRGLSDSR